MSFITDLITPRHPYTNMQKALLAAPVAAPRRQAASGVTYFTALRELQGKTTMHLLVP